MVPYNAWGPQTLVLPRALWGAKANPGYMDTSMRNLFPSFRTPLKPGALGRLPTLKVGCAYSSM